jgi:hypothetical protein
VGRAGDVVINAAIKEAIAEETAKTEVQMMERRKR